MNDAYGTRKIRHLLSLFHDRPFCLVSQAFTNSQGNFQKKNLMNCTRDVFLISRGTREACDASLQHTFSRQFYGYSDTSLNII